MAHPKLTAVVGRSFLTATAAALLAGPLAAAGAAATLDTVTDTVKLTCEEAFQTEDAKLIEEFCTQAELDELTAPLEKSVDKVTDPVQKVVDDTTDAAPAPVPDPAPDTNDGDTGTDPDAGSSPLPGTGTSDPEPENNGPNTGTQVGSTGDNFAGVDERSGSDGVEKGRTGPAQNRTPAEAQSYGYNADGPFRPGMRSHSSLTLQPFAAPLVSVPPVYELPQIAQQLFGDDSAVTAEDPMVAATQASPYSPAGYSATSADPTGWLAATATGLIMLVGAGHAINGGRTPKGQRI